MQVGVFNRARHGTATGRVPVLEQLDRATERDLEPAGEAFEQFDGFVDFVG